MENPIKERIRKIKESLPQNNPQYRRIMHKIGDLKNRLRTTDYQAIKFAEGEMSAEEFAPIKAQRKEWRAQINALQEELRNRG